MLDEPNPPPRGGDPKAPGGGRALSAPLLIVAMTLLAGPPTLGGSVIVHEVGPAAESAGLRPGDEALAWKRSGDGTSHGLENWWDLEMLIYTELAVAPVELEILREGENTTIVLPWRELSMSARPTAPAELLDHASHSPEEAVKLGPESGESELRRIGAGEDLVLWNLVRTGGALAEAKRLDAAAEWYERASQIAPAPFSAEIDRRLGAAYLEARRWPEAEAVLERGTAIWEDVVDGELGLSTLLSAQGDLQGALLRTARAKDLLTRACDLRRRHAPGSWFLANCLNNLGIVHGRRHDLAAAERLFLEALELDREGGSAKLFANLAIVSRLRGDFERAEAYCLRAIEHYRAAGEATHAARQSLNLANIVADAGELERARRLYGETLEDYQALYGPESPNLASLHLNRGQGSLHLGDLEAAERDLERARRLQDFERPRTSAEASVLSLLGEVRLGNGELRAAIGHLREALAFWEASIPDSSREARTASALGVALREAGDPVAAEKALRRSVRAIELQQARAGGGDRGLVAFRTKFDPLYRTYVEFLLDQGRETEAFELHERARAQALRALLRGRELDFATDEESAEVELARKHLGRTIEGTYRRLARLDPKDADGRGKLRAELEKLHAERDALSARLHAAAPRLAAVEIPPAASLEEVRDALPSGSLVLVYSLGTDDTTVFAIDRDRGLTVRRLDVGREEIGDVVARWADLVATPRTGRELEDPARKLSSAILAPIADRLAKAERLLVIPDGPLYRVAFGALPDPSRPDRFLVERLPITFDVSASVHTERSGDPTPRSIDRVAIFADPASSIQAVSRFRRDLGRLPASRLEAEAVREIFGDRAAVYLDREADETTARRELARASVTHFACHAVIDERLPLDSALVLADEGEHGLLQAWEIAEQLEVASDLVVLSACETARGGGGGSEGIVGLVRSLQIAGAHSVVATLWRVQDDSSSALMERFYRHLEGGADRAAALRSAQMELLGAPVEIVRDGRTIRLDASSPRHWAPFVLLGRDR